MYELWIALIPSVIAGIIAWYGSTKGCEKKVGELSVHMTHMCGDLKDMKDTMKFTQNEIYNLKIECAKRGAVCGGVNIGYSEEV